MTESQESVTSRHDMGPSRPAAVGERWEAVSLPIEHFRKMAESHWCAGWDCSTCITTKTICDLADALEAVAEVFPPGSLIISPTGYVEVSEKDASNVRAALGEVGL